MADNSVPSLMPTLRLNRHQAWKYETDEFHGICEIAHDQMVIKVTFSAFTKDFFDVLGIDGIIRWRLTKPVSVERLAEQLAEDFPDLSVTVSGRAKTHGWITSTAGKPWTPDAN